MLLLDKKPHHRDRITYDGFGQRLVKTVSPTYGDIYQYGQDGMLLEETDASGVAQADYIYLNGRPIAALNPSTGAVYYLQDDMLGTPQLATDSGQNIAWQATYQPFGTASMSGTFTQNLRFPGQYFDVESGWNHNGFRNYLPDLGRYAEPDPLAMRESAMYYDPRIGRFIPLLFDNDDTSVYAYVENNPVNWLDPWGLWHCVGGADCNITPPMQDAMSCFDKCTGHDTAITSARRPSSPRHPNSSHSRGEACDAGRHANPILDPHTVRQCFQQCFPHGYGQEEYNSGPGTHYHLQLYAVPGGHPGFANGVQPNNP